MPASSLVFTEVLLNAHKGVPALALDSTQLVKQRLTSCWPFVPSLGFPMREILFWQLLEGVL